MECPPPVHVDVSSVAPLRPRLLDRDGAARYLSVSTDVIDQLGAQGILRRVRLPGPAGGELRRVLYGVEDLDALVERTKDEATKG
jgi:hypothetical protein